MLRPLTLDQDWPLHDLAASRRLEAAALARQAPHQLMERAGLSLARLILALYPHGRRLWVLVGPGNNGGDGLLAASHLKQQGWEVLAHQPLDTGAAAGSDAEHARQRAHAAGLQLIADLPEQAPDCDLVLDALLGLGARAPQGELARAIAMINAQRAPVLAVDLPSGLCGNTGQALGQEVVRARHTLSLLSLKPGLLTGEGRHLAGDLWLDPLGEDPLSEPPGAWLSAATAWRRWPVQRQASSHKGRQGDVLVLGGAPGMRGAAWLAASAALAAGAGRVYAALPDDDDRSWPARPELMRWPEAHWQDARRWQDLTLVVGCGGGAAIATRLPSVLRHARRLVLDADALNLIAADADLQAQLQQRAGHGLTTLITPHPLEAARLLGRPGAAAVQADRLGAALTLAQQLSCSVILKGSGSVIASPGHALAINASGNAALATPGSGDVLAGWLGGLWAQAHEGKPHALALAGCSWHGAAAAGWAGPLRATELIERMATLHPAAA